MEFDFNINHIFTNRITKFDNQIKLFNTDKKEAAQSKNLACTVIDKLGIASSKAQGLRVAVTSTSKLKDSNHLIYLLKAEVNRNTGVAIGFLKIGYKTLFVYDNKETIHELNPMCVLDFYIHESRQRQGLGKELFQHMLQDTGLQPFQLAIDKPSFKFSSFLKKHYNLIHIIPQTNNFVIFQGFFDQKKDIRLRKKPLFCMNHYNQDNIFRNTNANLQIPIRRMSLLEKEKVSVEGEQLKKLSALVNPQPLINPPQVFPEEKPLPAIPSSKQTPLEPKKSPIESRSSPVTETTRIRTPPPTVKPHRATPLPLAEEYSRYHSSVRRTPPEEAGEKNNSISGTQRANVVKDSGHHRNVSPLVVTKQLDPLSMYTNRYPYTRQYANLLSYVDPSKISLPQIEQKTPPSSCFRHDNPSSLPSKQIPNNVPWTLFSNVAKYHSLVKRGYSHTHIW